MVYDAKVPDMVYACLVMQMCKTCARHSDLNVLPCIFKELSCIFKELPCIFKKLSCVSVGILVDMCASSRVYQGPQ